MRANPSPQGRVASEAMPGGGESVPGGASPPRSGFARVGPPLRGGIRHRAWEAIVTDQNRRIVLASRPVGEPKPTDFRLESAPVPEPGPGQVLLRTLWLSLDPYMRGRMSDAPSYAAPVEIGQVMEGGTVSDVLASHVGGFAVGDIVVGRTGWQTHALSDGRALRKVD